MQAAAASLTKEDELHWLALRMVPGLGTRRAGLLLQSFRTPQAIFRASRSELEAAGLSQGVAQNVASGCAFDDAVDQQNRAAAAGAVLIPTTGAHYPALLREIYDPPPLMFALGRTALLDSLMLGVVGTRRPTAYGIAAATRLAKDLANAGLTIVSGMARGIDTAAHKAVIDAGGDTIAVLGCGVDQVYPAENRKLAEVLAEKALVLSEFPMGDPPYPQNFPVRNRIISGMSAGVLVVEGGEYSGSSITAKLAAEQNREVFAVPGNITSKMSWGPNLLIKQGAKLVQEWNDVVVELKATDRQALVQQARKRLQIKGEDDAAALPESNNLAHTSLLASPMGGIARSVLQTLKPDAPVGLDHLIETTEGASSSEIIAVLFELEMAGLVRQVPGKNFLRVWAD